MTNNVIDPSKNDRKWNFILFIQYVRYYRLCYININKVRHGAIDWATPRISELRMRHRRLKQDLLICCCNNRGNQSDKHSPACNWEGEHGSLLLLSYRHFVVLKAMAEQWNFKFWEFCSSFFGNLSNEILHKNITTKCRNSTAKD